MTSPTPALVPVSVIVHVLNEMQNLPHALATVCGKFDEVFVVDAGSTDGTQDIARQFGATLVQITGDRTTLVKQRNWALDHLPTRHDWVYILDADEWVPDDLLAEIEQRVREPLPDIDGYWVRYKEVILGRPLMRAALYPNWNMRLFKRSVARYEDRKVNAHVKVEPGRSGQLQAHFIHNDRRGFSSYIRRMASITVIEALSLDELYSPQSGLVGASLFSSSFVSRRRALKKIFYRLPFRPLIIFLYLYVWRMGFLEGRPGLYHCLYRACTEILINALRFEARQVRG
jgi:glycosyltransferase involved in cell wall biosynthesis